MLGLNGIGPETADSILLYAGQHPVFVVDAYTRRVFERHGVVAASASYEEIRALFERALVNVREVRENENRPEFARAASLRPGASHPPSRMSLVPRTELSQVFNEMHGLIVGVGKHYCAKSHPKCDECPLRAFLPPMK